MSKLIQFTDDEFLDKFMKDCQGSPIGPTERMLYYLGLAIMGKLDRIVHHQESNSRLTELLGEGDV